MSRTRKLFGATDIGVLGRISILKHLQPTSKVMLSSVVSIFIAHTWRNDGVVCFFSSGAHQPPLSVFSFKKICVNYDMSPIRVSCISIFIYRVKAKANPFLQERWFSSLCMAPVKRNSFLSNVVCSVSCTVCDRSNRLSRPVRGFIEGQERPTKRDKLEWLECYSSKKSFW